MDVGHGLFAPGSRVLDAQRVLSREHPVDAIGGAHTLADVLGPALHDLLHDIGIGHVAAGHGDHVDMAVGDRAGRRLGVGNRSRVEHHHPGLGPHGTGQVKLGGGALVHAGHGIGEGLVVLHLAADHVQVVDHAAVGEYLGDLHTVGLGQPAFEILVARKAHADDEVVAHVLAHLGQDIPREPGPVLQAAAIAVGALVDAGGPEAVDQVLIGALELAAVEAAFLGPPRRLAVVAHDAREVPVLHLSGGGCGVQVLAHPRGGYRGQPRVRVPRHLAADMGELDHQLRAVLVDPVGELLEVGDDRIVRGRELVVLDRRGNGIPRPTRSRGLAWPSSSRTRAVNSRSSQTVALGVLLVVGLRHPRSTPSHFN